MQYDYLLLQGLSSDNSLTVCLDGNFGLVRKKNSGRSWEPPKHGSRFFFIEDDVVRNFVEKCPSSDDGDDKNVRMPTNQ
jgi:hypothetical protein